MSTSTDGTTSTVVPRRLLGRWRVANLVALSGLTVYSTALGWQAQLVSYPLFRAVGPREFADYHRQYNEAIPVVVIAPGFLCFLGCAAFFWTRPTDVTGRLAAVVSGAGVVSLLSTVLWAIPMHDRLDEIGQSAATIDSLLTSNLVRTLALTVGSLALGWAVLRRMR